MNHHYIEDINNEEELNVKVQYKSKKSKKINKNSKDCSIGKPKGLNQVQIERPDIWTLDEKSLKLINYFLMLGRHILVNSHTNLSKQSEEKKIQIQEYKETNKPIIQHLQFIAEYLFEYPCQKYKVVYFFKDDLNCQKKQINIGEQLNNPELKKFLKKTYFLFNNKFIFELQRLFEMFEQQKTIDQISEIMIQESLNNNTENQTQIIQSMYLFLQKQNTNQIELFSKVSSSNLEKLKKNFYQTIKESKETLSEIILTIRNIFYENSDLEYQNQYPSTQNQYDESNYIQL